MNNKLIKTENGYSIELKPIHKFNGGNGATLCLCCSNIIQIGITDDLFCSKCLERNFKQIKLILDLTDYKKEKQWIKY